MNLFARQTITLSALIQDGVTYSLRARFTRPHNGGLKDGCWYYELHTASPDSAATYSYPVFETDGYNINKMLHLGQDYAQGLAHLIPILDSLAGNALLPLYKARLRETLRGVNQAVTAGVNWHNLLLELIALLSKLDPRQGYLAIQLLHSSNFDPDNPYSQIPANIADAVKFALA